MTSHIGYLIKSINDKVKIHADADLKSHNLTLAQSRVLVYLQDRADGKATQKEIEVYLSVSHPTVVGLVSRMENNGFLTSWLDADDRRNKIVQLTQSAKAIGKNMDSVIRGMEEKMLLSLSENQVSQLTEMLEIIYKNLE